MQEHSGSASMLSSSGTTELCVLLTVAVVAVSIVCYTVCNHVYFNRAELGELDELLLQEEDLYSELITLKFSQECSNMTYIILSMAVLCAVVCVYCIFPTVSQSTDEGAQWKQAFCEMYKRERQLNAEMRVNTSQHEADKDSLRRRYERELFTTDERYREILANQKENIAGLQSKLGESQRKVDSLQQKCKRLEIQLQSERDQKEKLKKKLKLMRTHTPPESKNWCSRISGQNRSISACVIF